MKPNSLLLAALAGFAAIITPSGATEKSVVTKAQQREIVAAIGERIHTDIYDQEVAKSYLAALDQFEAGGKFGPDVGSDEFALSIHRALHRAKIDFHLSIFGPRLMQDHGDAHEEGPASEHFITVIDEEDDIRMITFDTFVASTAAISEMYDVFHQVENARGIIFDLRGNLGGDSTLARLMLGCLFAKPVELYSIKIPNGEHARHSRYRSKPLEKCASVANAPIAVLVDHNTASTAELFAFMLQNRARAVIVGEQTLGGGHVAETYSLPHGFSMVLPIGYVRDELTGEDWERVGVTPDIVVRPVEARMHAVEAINASIACEDAKKSAGRALAGFACATSGSVDH